MIARHLARGPIGPALVLTLCCGASPQAIDGDVAGMRSLQDLDRRVFAIGYRLAAAGADLCPQTVALTGMQIHVLDQYPASERAAARAAFGLTSWPAVLAVAPSGPAAQAGIREDDSIVAIDGIALSASPSPEAGYTRARATIDLLEKAAAAGSPVLTIRRGDAEREIVLHPKSGCPSRFQTVSSDALRAQADGTYVEISAGIAAYARSDAELAGVIAHELAHNILRHRARLDAAGIRRGVLQEFGRNARLTRATEFEADRLGVYLVDRAGYPMAAIVDYWTRFRRERGAGMFGSRTHPGEKQRIDVIQAEIARVEAARAAGSTPVPAFGPWLASPPSAPPLRKPSE